LRNNDGDSGEFLFAIDADPLSPNFNQIGLAIEPENARALAIIGVNLRDLIAAEIDIAHPETPEINGIAYVMFRSDEPDGAIRTCTTLKPGRVNRSPCGTGSNANMALRHTQR
jgi:proline racemase